MNYKVGIHHEKNKFKIEKNTKILTGSAKYTENRWPKIILKNK